MNKLETLRQWFEDVYLSCHTSNAFPFNMDAIRAKFYELQSQAPDNLEGYLEGKVFVQGEDEPNVVTEYDALAALQQLAEDKDAEWDKKLCDNAFGWVQKCNELKAENERLKEKLLKNVPEATGLVVVDNLNKKAEPISEPFKFNPPTKQ